MLNIITSFLFSRIDNSKLIAFRVFFGFLMAVESWGAILTGWVKKTFVEPSFTFTFFGFEWTQFLLGETMYYYFIIMGIFGILIMLGKWYRFASIGFFMMWALVYFMQKSHYNNHYYLVFLVAGIMMIAPANAYFSLDAKKNSKIIMHSMFRLWTVLFQTLIAFVYFYAAIAKLYPGWLENKFLSIRLHQSANYFRYNFHWNAFADLLENTNFQYTLTYSGILFDFLIVPILLFPATRKIGFMLMVVFHIFNSIVLQIGIFPYFALALAVFYFPNQSIQKLFFKKKVFYQATLYSGISVKDKMIGYLAVIFIFIQFVLPLRHHLIKDSVLWTEEGHRLSWRMMLRTKSSLGFVNFTVINNETKETIKIDLREYLTIDQIQDLSTKPDMIFQFTQYLEKQLNKKGYPSVAIYVNTKINVNGGKYYSLIDNEIDFTKVKWNYFGHQDWILSSPEEYR